MLADLPRPLGLVPTMGWLHRGHRSLMQRARAENATTIATIFVNPRQFNEAADYQRYPRNEARDLEVCRDEAIDIVFAPDVDEVYPPGFDTTVVVGAVAGPLEGAARPGHFDGVATVVAILFGLIGAERAYFGQKDAQQVLVIRQMARDLAIPTEVIACPTVREPDGLALSSRNVHLSPEQRAAAPVLRRALLAGRERWLAGERSADGLRAAMTEVLRRRAAGHAGLRERRRWHDAGRARPDRRRPAGAPVARGPLRLDPPDRQRAPGRLAAADATTRTRSSPGAVRPSAPALRRP